MRRAPLVALAVLGLGLIAAPAIFGMWSRAPQGKQMIADFEPFMTHARLDGFSQHVAVIDAGVHEGARLTGRSPDWRELVEAWPGIHADMTDLLTRIEANVGNYAAVHALPPFDEFPWFFVIPGALVALLAGVALVQPRARGGARIGLVVLGVGLLLAPAAFQMFTRAPKGGRMMQAFRTIETRHKVETIQGYFGTIAVGQGAARLELLPGLDRSRYPALGRLESRWTGILNDLTPMIGAMSDNVARYEAVAALPPFPLFPWFFVLPGLLVVGLAWAAGSSPRTSTRKATMIRRILPGLGLLSALAALAFAGPANAANLSGTFKLSRGHYAHGRPSGSYFRMAFPGGGRYFRNPDSRATDRTYTLIAPGSSGGLVTGRFQVHPIGHAFDGRGNSRASAIIRPTPFAGVRFGLATLPTDPQSKRRAPAPSVTLSGSRLTARLQAFTAEWNKQYFNQGAPKPGGSAPTASGAYNARTHRFSLTWRSVIKGGAFNGFTGEWHLAGTFQGGARGAAVARAASTHKHRRKPCKHGRSRKTHRCKHKPRRTATTPPATTTAPSGAQPLTGTLAITAGGTSAGKLTGSYFKMVYPGGSRTSGPYFQNPDSPIGDGSTTPVRPGTDGGLTVGAFQEPPVPPFDGNGNALAARIVAPQRFGGVNFSLSTAAKDPQTGTAVPVPALYVREGRITGKIQALTASWNGQWFNQGSPKPDGGTPGLTSAVTGTLSPDGAFALDWASAIVGGPFNGFTGVWHLAGTHRTP